MNHYASEHFGNLSHRLGRRDWLKSAAGSVSGAMGLGTVGLGALGPNPLMAESIAPNPAARAKSVILIFNCGAPSHIDLWDPKPNAPSNIRGTFRTIDTTVPGLQVTELLPKIAQHADKRQEGAATAAGRASSECGVGRARCRGGGTRPLCSPAAL